jgi:hypothetical protein
VGGPFKDANCTVKAVKASEKQFAFKKGGEKLGFTAAGGVNLSGLIWFQDRGGQEVVCNSETATGKYDADGLSGAIREVEAVVLRFQACEDYQATVPCQEIVTNPLRGPLGDISGEGSKTPVVGIQLTPETAKGLFVTIHCGQFSFEVRGVQESVEGRAGGNCVIPTFAQPNVMSTSFTETYLSGGSFSGEQVPQHFQLSTSKFCNFEDHYSPRAGWDRMGLSLEAAVTNEEALEIKA